MLYGKPEHGRPELGERRARAAAVVEVPRLLQTGAEVVAHGALICPECRIPVRTDRPIPAREALSCAFCEHTDRAREFLAPDVFDTLENEVYMVARIRASVS